jgi:DNA-binding HxlR family transcriptional regulator
MKQDTTLRVCSVARSLEILGDRWVFLILRETFFGVRYYDEFLANLGIATNILSQRLRILVDNGILKRRKDEKDARRVRYSLTEKGMGIYSITLALMEWGDRWLAGKEGPPLLLRHETCGHRLRPVVCCAHCGEEVHGRDISFKDGPGAKGSPGKRPLAKAKKWKKTGGKKVRKKAVDEPA